MPDVHSRYLHGGHSAAGAVGQRGVCDVVVFATFQITWSITQDRAKDQKDKKKK